MTKKANTRYSILKHLSDRWSPRAFNDKMPERETLLKLLEAARWAPSSFNEQPWRFVIGIKGEGESYENLFEGLNEFNQKWAKTAPVAVFICAKKTFSHNGKDNKHFMYDCGAAMSNLCVQATEEGLYVHQMAGILPDVAREKLNVPDGFEPITAAMVGYIGDPDQLNDDMKESEMAERKRKDLSEIAFFGKWGESFD
ncbi:nitroreductase [Fulvivirga sp. RKSG066]|uniref:nitroreductase family protein n=1 Tax=Fulvivirga aurantia TaxID=2529383 RepID=UPI0012BB7492|nr:nitroreductase family protein [Fulvivirga aurantia]MTI21925.1 nitroreductase [Fulvivirga aurantia]